MTLLYQLPARANPRPKIYGLTTDDDQPIVVEFDHIDGAYSYCIAYDADGQELGLTHLSAGTPLVKFKDGFKVAD